MRIDYTQHSGPWNCLHCAFKVPYDPSWQKMSSAITEHAQEHHLDKIAGLVFDKVPIAPAVPQEPTCVCGGHVSEHGYCPVHMPSKVELQPRMIAEAMKDGSVRYENPSIVVPGIDPIEGVQFHKFPPSMLAAMEAQPSAEKVVERPEPINYRQMVESDRKLYFFAHEATTYMDKQDAEIATLRQQLFGWQESFTRSVDAGSEFLQRAEKAEKQLEEARRERDEAKRQQNNNAVAAVGVGEMLHKAESKLWADANDKNAAGWTEAVKELDKLRRTIADSSTK